MERLRIKIASVLVFGLIVSGCQTTSRQLETTQEVDIRDTKIDAPPNLDIQKVEIKETGSMHREIVYFSEGLFFYDRYFRGGFKNTNADSIVNYIGQVLSKAVQFATVKKTSLKISDVFYTTFRDQNQSCFAMLGNSGNNVKLRRGPGTDGQIFGLYCVSGQQKNIEEAALNLFRGFRIR